MAGVGGKFKSERGGDEKYCIVVCLFLGKTNHRKERKVCSNSEQIGEEREGEGRKSNHDTQYHKVHI